MRESYKHILAKNITEVYLMPIQKSTKIGERQDFFYLKHERDYHIFYQNIKKILIKEFKFDTLEEKGPVKYEPINSKFSVKIIARKDKDPRTALLITIKFSYKRPNVKDRVSKETFLVNLSYKGEVVTTYKTDTEKQRWIFQEKLRNFLEKNFYKKERGKYKGECKKLIESIRVKIRELYEEPPSIAKK